MRNNNKEISQTFFNACTLNRRLTRGPSPPLLLLLPGLHLRSITMPVCPPAPRLSATADVTPAGLCSPIHHPFLLFHSS